MGTYQVARLRLQRATAHGERLARLWNEIPTGDLCTPKAKLVDSAGNGALIATKVGRIPDELMNCLYFSVSSFINSDQLWMP